MNSFYFGFLLRAISKNYALVTYGFLTVNLLLILTWYYRKFLKPYTQFPFYNMLTYFLYAYFIKKTPRAVPLRNILSQKTMLIAKQYESEGLVLLWGFATFLMVFGTEATKALLLDNKLSDKASYYRFMNFLGTGLITSNGETWKKHRKLFAPAFHTDMLKRNINLFNEHAKLLVKNLAESKEKPVIILDFLKPCSFGIICESILGLKMHSDEHEDLATEYLNQITKGVQLMSKTLIYPWRHLKRLFRFTSFSRESVKFRKDHYSLVRRIITHMKESVSGKQEEYDSERLFHKFFAQILLDQHSKDPSFTMKDVEYQLTTFLSAGYDTVSYTMMWCLFFLGHHQEIQERAYREVTSETGDFITFDSICNLKYLESVIKETLRLHPTVPFYGRQCKEDIKLGKYTVPKNTNIIFNIYALHRNPEIFPNPEKFDPDRFFDGKSAIQYWEFTPFAVGSRQCIGKKFAMWEMEVILAHVLRKFKIVSLDKIDDISLGWEVVLTPSSPLRVQLTERE